MSIAELQFSILGRITKPAPSVVVRIVILLPRSRSLIGKETVIMDLNLFCSPDPVGPLGLVLEGGPPIRGILPGGSTAGRSWGYTHFQTFAQSTHIDPGVLWHDCQFGILGHSIDTPDGQKSEWREAIWWSDGMPQPAFGGSPNFKKDVFVAARFCDDIRRFLTLGVTEIAAVVHDPRVAHTWGGVLPWDGCPLKPLDVRGAVNLATGHRECHCFVGFTRTGGQVILKSGEPIRSVHPGSPKVNWDTMIEVVEPIIPSRSRS